jgi:hypothetical protein
MEMKSKALLKFWNFWPPFLASGIRITKISPNFREVEVEMKLRFWNSNYVGTHYGGSLYSMTDPFFMIMLIQNLGPEFIVWDKAAKIQFKKPGKGRVRAHFVLSEDRVNEIKEKALQEGKVEPQFQVQILNEDGSVVAEVEKTLYVRKKNKSPASPSTS